MRTIVLVKGGLTERRAFKNKTKQSGGFRSEEGKQRYCDFLSVAKTAQLHGMGPLAAASAVFGSKGC